MRSSTIAPAVSLKYNTFNACSTNPAYTGYCGIRHRTWDALRQLVFRTSDERSSERVFMRAVRDLSRPRGLNAWLKP